MAGMWGLRASADRELARTIARLAVERKLSQHYNKENYYGGDQAFLGDMVYPLGGKEEMWWEVEDENGNVGWVENDKLKPIK